MLESASDCTIFLFLNECARPFEQFHFMRMENMCTIKSMFLSLRWVRVWHVVVRVRLMMKRPSCLQHNWRYTHLMRKRHREIEMLLYFDRVVTNVCGRSLFLIRFQEVTCRYRFQLFNCIFVRCMRFKFREWSATISNAEANSCRFFSRRPFGKWIVLKLHARVFLLFIDQGAMESFFPLSANVREIGRTGRR